MTPPTIDAQALLAQMRAMASEARGINQPEIVSNGTKPEGVDFGDAMRNAIDFVNARQQEASALATKFEQGAPGVELADVMVAIQKANVSFQAATQVRNRLVSAYQDIMNMPL